MSASIRTSILMFYLRIFGQAVTSVRYTVLALLVLQGVYVIVYMILPAFIAKPFNKIWQPLERGKYMNDWYYYYTQVALFSTSMAFDIILLVLPIHPVTQLQMTVKKRIGVIAIFICGAAYAPFLKFDFQAKIPLAQVSQQHISSPYLSLKWRDTRRSIPNVSSYQLAFMKPKVTKCQGYNTK
jgi:hypothetical protein